MKKTTQITITVTYDLEKEFDCPQEVMEDPKDLREWVIEKAESMHPKVEGLRWFSTQAGIQTEGEYDELVFEERGV